MRVILVGLPFIFTTCLVVCWYDVYRAGMPVWNSHQAGTAADAALVVLFEVPSPPFDDVKSGN